MAEEQREQIAPAPTAPIGTAAPAGTTASVGTTTQSGPAPGQSGGLLDMLPMLVGMVLIFYFLIIRPEKKRQQHQRELLGAIKKNDRVILAGVGMYCEVAEIEGDEVTLIIDKKKDVRIKVRKEAIGGIVNEEKKS